MFIVGECIHVISKRVREAIENRDAAFIQDLARRQAEKGAKALDLNIGPQRRTGPEVMGWMVDTVQSVVDIRLSLDTTNPDAIEAGLQRCKTKAIINSTDASPDRLATMLPLAAKYNADIIALTFAGGGLPSSTDARVQLAIENIIPATMEYGVPLENIFFDPLVLTVNGNQDQVVPTIEAIRFFKQMSDPPPKTICGLSNVSNGAPREVRPIINRVFLCMAMGAGLDAAIADPLDEDVMQAVRVMETREAKTPVDQLYLAIFDSYAAGGPFDSSGWDLTNPDIRDLVRTVDVLENKWIYAHSYLRL
jgi:5-methyltetrahydrofolate corrinoid/iron sulfur protein methyltransferase